MLTYMMGEVTGGHHQRPALMYVTIIPYICSEDGLEQIRSYSCRAIKTIIKTKADSLAGSNVKSVSTFSVERNGNTGCRGKG